MDCQNNREDVFLTTEFGVTQGFELHYWAEINELAMKNGWMNSSIVYVGIFKMDDHDDTYILFRDMDTNRNYVLTL